MRVLKKPLIVAGVFLAVGIALVAIASDRATLVLSAGHRKHIRSAC